MSADTPEPRAPAPDPSSAPDPGADIARVKAAWRKHAASLTWEEKVAAIERMRERDAVLRREREAVRVARRVDTPPELK